MVMRLGWWGGCGRLCTHLWSDSTQKSENTQITLQTPYSHIGMGMHANTGMYINAQMPTLNTQR